MEAPRSKREEMTADLLSILDNIELIVKQMVTAGSQAFLYSGEHPAVREYVERAYTTMREILVRKESFAISAREGMLVYENIPLYRLSMSARKFIDYLEAKKIHGMIVARGLAFEELLRFVEVLVSPAVRVQGREEFNKELAGRGVRAITVMEIKKEDEKEWAAREPKVVYEEVVRLMRAFAHAAIRKKKFPFGESDVLVSEIAEIVSKDPRAMLDLVSIRDFDEHAFTHAANVCVLVTAFAALYGADRPRLAPICQAALLHDIGKLSLPPEIFLGGGEPTPGQAEILRRHPVEGARALEEAEGARPLAVVVAFEHHIQYDRKGYPATKAGHRPLPISLLVQTADAYDNLTAPLRGRPPLTRVGALEEIAAGAGTVFDAAIVKGFLGMMGYYVPGTLVELDTGEVAVVEEMRGDNPSRPTVKILRGGERGARIDLAEKGPGGEYRKTVRRPLGGEDQGKKGAPAQAPAGP